MLASVDGKKSKDSMRFWEKGVDGITRSMKH